MSDTQKLNPIDKYIGQRVKKTRQRAGKSSANIACYLGYREEAYNKRETGIIRFRAEELFELAALFNTRISYFFDGMSGIWVDKSVDSQPQQQSSDNQTCQTTRLLRQFSEIPDDNEREFLIQLANNMTQRTEPYSQTKV